MIGADRGALLPRGGSEARGNKSGLIQFNEESN